MVDSDRDSNPKLKPTAIKPKTIVFIVSSDLIKNGEITPAENHVAARVFKNSESDFNWFELKLFISEFIIHYLLKKWITLSSLGIIIFRVKMKR